MRELAKAEPTVCGRPKRRELKLTWKKNSVDVAEN
jgi:hypothetical protein